MYVFVHLGERVGMRIPQPLPGMGVDLDWMPTGKVNLESIQSNTS